MTDNLTPGKKLLAIFAHPDDELFISPVLANYARHGVEVYLAVVTDGRFGIQPHTGGVSGDALAAMRKDELFRAAEVLGIHEPVWMAFTDGFAHKTADLQTILGQFSDLFRAVTDLFKTIEPDAVITFGSDGIYGHPDHLMVGNAVTAAFQSSDLTGNPALFYPGLSVDAVPDKLIERVGSDTGTLPVFPLADKYLPVRIEVEAIDLEIARTSLACHKSQFIEKEMNRVSRLFHSRTRVYFRSWNGRFPPDDSLFI